MNFDDNRSFWRAEVGILKNLAVLAYLAQYSPSISYSGFLSFDVESRCGCID